MYKDIALGTKHWKFPEENKEITETEWHLTSWKEKLNPDISKNLSIKTGRK